MDLKESQNLIEIYKLIKIIYIFVLALFWIIFSGFFKAPLLILGVISCLISVYFAAKLGAFRKREYNPIFLKPRGIFYGIWLIKEILVSSMKVALKSLSWNVNISPQFAKVSTKQRTDIGKAAYGNSITLTPGTVCIGIEGRECYVHALEKNSVKDLDHSRGGGDMDKKLEGIYS